MWSVCSSVCGDFSPTLSSQIVFFSYSQPIPVHTGVVRRSPAARLPPELRCAHVRMVGCLFAIAFDANNICVSFPAGFSGSKCRTREYPAGFITTLPDAQLSIVFASPSVCPIVPVGGSMFAVERGGKITVQVGSLADQLFSSVNLTDWREERTVISRLTSNASVSSVPANPRLYTEYVAGEVHLFLKFTLIRTDSTSATVTRSSLLIPLNTTIEYPSTTYAYEHAVAVISFACPALPLMGYTPLLLMTASDDPVSASTLPFVPGRTERNDLVFFSDSACILEGWWYDQTLQQCRECPSFAVCPGGGRVFPKFGYWSLNERTLPVECTLPESCPGAVGKYRSFVPRTRSKISVPRFR